jgi:hypothetical protein
MVNAGTERAVGAFEYGGTGCPNYDAGNLPVKVSRLRAGVHAPIKSVSVPAPISFFPPVKPRSAVHTPTKSLSAPARRSVS